MPAPRSPQELDMGHTSSEVLHGMAAEAFARREAPGAALADVAERLASACHDMAVRFLRGGKLLAFGNGGPSTDAQHVSVEFVHPVIVGKRALSALSLVTDAATLMGVARRSGLDEVFAHQVGVLGSGDDIALGISSDGRCRNVLRGLAGAVRASSTSASPCRTARVARPRVSSSRG
jgi:D-sedoheptulose 7-phosphate isomerase